MDELTKLRKIAEVSHLSFLFGAGASSPYIKPLSAIEVKMDEAERKGDVEGIRKLKKEFFSSVIEPCLKIPGFYRTEESNATADLPKTYDDYKVFIIEITRYLLTRKSTLLNKQVNLFTTNIDIFLEKVLEDIGANYNDGFVGHLAPSFRTSNFQTLLKKKSEYSESQSEIPTFNLYKLHGSLTWKLDKDKKNIIYSDLSCLNALGALNGDAFDTAYSEVQIVNPNRKKFETSVLESTYYELLRLYATELEKENTFVVAIGFSFEDRHVLEVTRRAMDSNPTLSLCVICHKEENYEKYKEKFEGIRYEGNLHLIKPEKDKEFDLRWAVENLICKLDKNTDTHDEK